MPRRRPVELAWSAWARLPEPARGLAAPLVAASRRRRLRTTPLPGGPRPELPPEAIELDTLIGTLWFDRRNERMLPWIRRHGTWEADVLRYLRTVLRPGATFLDVGANVGFHTVAAAQLVSPSGTVIAVEPLPVSLALLRANLWRHRVEGARVLPVAAAAEPGTARLAVDAAHSSGAHLSDTGTVEVQAARLDDLLPDTRVDVLKLDVEGAEPLALRGAAELIGRSVGLVAVVEFRDEPHAGIERPADVLGFYRSLGFELCLLPTSGVPQPAGDEEILRRARGRESLNIVLRRRPGGPGAGMDGRARG